MNLFALVDGTNVIREISPVAFSVAQPMRWTADISELTPQPQTGWAATEAAGVWTFTAPETAAVTWDHELAARINNGVNITSTSTPALNSLYALDTTTLDQIGSVARDAASGIGLPGGGSTFTYPDAAGVPHSFTSAQIITLYRAMRDLLFVLNTQAAIMRLGGPPTWPDQSVTIA